MMILFVWCSVNVLRRERRQNMSFCRKNTDGIGPKCLKRFQYAQLSRSAFRRDRDWCSSGWKSDYSITTMKNVEIFYIVALWWPTMVHVDEGEENFMPCVMPKFRLGDSTVAKRKSSHQNGFLGLVYMFRTFSHILWISSGELRCMTQPRRHVHSIAECQYTWHHQQMRPQFFRIKIPFSTFTIGFTTKFLDGFVLHCCQHYGSNSEW